MRKSVFWVMLLLTVSCLGYFSIPLFSHSDRRDNTVFNLPDKKDKIVTGQWCQRFYHLLSTVCVSHGGDQMICQDKSLRKIIKETGGPTLICMLNHLAGVSYRQCVNGLAFYTKRCSIINNISYIKSGFKFYNLNTRPDTKNKNLQTKHSKYHTLIIGIDGVRLDAFQKAYGEMRANHKLSALTNFIHQYGIDGGFFAGGIKGSATQQQTLSEPGWTSTLTGVWANQHGLQTNGDTAEGKYNHRVPTLYNLMKMKISNVMTASYTDWKPIGVVAGYSFNAYQGADINRLYEPNDFNSISAAGRKMTSDIIEEIQGEQAPALTYVHYTNPDDTGHIYGFSPNSTKYMSALKDELVNANKLIAAVNKKSKPWLVIITTDHGGHNTIHGTQQSVDRQVFAVIGTTRTHEALNHHTMLGQTAFTPIVLHYERTGSLEHWQQEKLTS